MFQKFHPNGYPDVTVVKMPKKFTGRVDFAMCEQPRQTLSQFYKSETIKPSVLINGGFFCMADGTTVFDYMDEGKILVDNPDTTLGFGVLGDNTMLQGTITGKKWRDFVAAYPPLVIDGKPAQSLLGKEIDYNARRTIIGYDTDNYYAIIVEGKGLNFRGCRELCLSLGLDYAINLDGGGSTHMLFYGKRVSSILYNRAVDNVVAFYDVNACPPVKPEEPETPRYYRVQVGAFRSRQNAERLRQKIVNLSDTIGAGYARAYIRQINGLYKVQVGAFSKRPNAERVLDDLRAKGIEGYITT